MKNQFAKLSKKNQDVITQLKNNLDYDKFVQSEIKQAEDIDAARSSNSIKSEQNVFEKAEKHARRQKYELQHQNQLSTDGKPSAKLCK